MPIFDTHPSKGANEGSRIMQLKIEMSNNGAYLQDGQYGIIHLPWSHTSHTVAPNINMIYSII